MVENLTLTDEVLNISSKVGKRKKWKKTHLIKGYIFKRLKDFIWLEAQYESRIRYDGSKMLVQFWAE